MPYGNKKGGPQMGHSPAEMGHSPAEMGHSPAEMGHSPAEMKGSWMSKHAQHSRLGSNPDIKYGGDVIDQTAQKSAMRMNHDKKDPVSGFGSAYAAARKSGKETFNYKGKPYSTLSKEEAQRDLREGDMNIKNFTSKKGYDYYPLMGYDNKQISQNVQSIVDKQKKAAHALGKPERATKFENPFNMEDKSPLEGHCMGKRK